MKKTFLTLLLLVTSLFACAQENNEAAQAETNTEKETQATLQHKVLMGETVILICKKYVVAPEAIYELNPEAVDGISPGMMLTIPVSDKKAGTQARTKPEDTSITSRPAKKQTQ